MADLHSYVYGERPRLAAVVVAAVGMGTSALLVPHGLFGIGVSGLSARIVFVIAFGVLPALGGGVCGWHRLGFPAAAASGVAPGVAFYLVVAVGTALDVGTFGGGDSPLGPFAVFLASPGFVLATISFALAAAISIRRE